MAPPMPPTPPAGWGLRASAWLIDFVPVLVVAALLAWWTWTRITTLIKDVPGLAKRGAWEVVGSGGDVQTASAEFGSSLWGSASGYVMQAFALLVLFVFMYHFAALAWTGRTPGKVVCGLRVEAEDGRRLGKPQALGLAGARAVTDMGVYAIACWVLLQGMIGFSVFMWLIAVAVFWADALPVLLARRALHDRALHTRVVRAHLIRTAAQHAALGGRVAANYAAQGGRAAAQHAAEGGRAAFQGAQRIAEHERVRNQQERARNLGRGAANAGRGAVEAGRRGAVEAGRGAAQAGRGAAGKGREALEKARQAYNERRRPSEAPPPPPAIGPPQPPSVPFQQPYPEPGPQAQPNYRIPRPEDQ
jgi:uncharacterized RDD family membrane protein YckC